MKKEMEQDLKDIAEVLDFSPVLTQEQLWLAEELRKSVFSYKISILKAHEPASQLPAFPQTPQESCNYRAGPSASRAHLQ